MLFWLKKTLTIPFLPLYFSLLSGLFGLTLLCLTKRQKLARFALFCSLGSLLLFSNKGVAMRLVGPLENRYPPIPEIHSQAELPSELKACVAIVVLGGGHSDVPAMSRVNQLSTASMSRIGEAVRLSRWLPDAKFVTSGHHLKEISHAQVLAEAAMSLGIAPERIVRMDEPRDTEDEILGLAQRFPGKPVAIVTSAWHMPRTMELCTHFRVKAVPCPTDYLLKLTPEQSPEYVGWDLQSLEQSTRAIHEYLGILWLRLRGK
jgi:uncharacterized SAM-binding protein YcdF (DUF218 family)